MIVSAQQRGPLRVAIEAYGGALSLFRKGERNRAKKLALMRGGAYWLAVWMLRRFSKYAYFLGYRASERWNKRKQRQLGSEPIPFYGLTPPGGGPAAPGYAQVNGAKMHDAVRGAYVSAVGIDGRESITIHVPYGHPLRTEDSLSFKKLPQREIRLVAGEVAAELARIIRSAGPIGAKLRTQQPGAIAGPTLKLSDKYARRSMRQTPRRVR